MLYAHRTTFSFVFFSLATAAIAAAACGGGGNTTGSGASGASTSGSGGASSAVSSSSGMGGTGGTLFGTGGMFGGPYKDFPSTPIVDMSAPMDAPGLFGPPDMGNPSGGPCLAEPEPNALFPSNWLRPRFRVIPPGGQNLFEIRLHSESQVNDLVVYTASTSWTMPKDLWTAITSHSVDSPFTVTVRSASFNGTTLDGPPSLGAGGSFTIAPAEASGAIVYWTTSNGSSLKGFQVGDEAVASTLIPSQVQMPTVGSASVTCIGCHTSTPDGKFVGFVAQGPWGNVVASIEPMTVGQQPMFVGQGALQTLGQFGELGIQAYSKAHWKAGDRIMVTPFDAYQNAKLAWIDLEAQAFGEGTSYGFFQRNGDPRGVGSPAWSHDGATLLYVSTDAEFTGRLDNGYADLYTVPYNNKQGGNASPVPGASDPNLEEYYPSYSPDDQMIVFNRIPSNTNMYNASAAEVFVIPAQGGTATRLAANDPPACMNKPSPGITNSWPKWAPEQTTIGAKRYYWLVFSSVRSTPNPQLYMTGVVVEGSNVSSYGAVYLWNQPSNESNHTPAWDVFKIPSVPPQ